MKIFTLIILAILWGLISAIISDGNFELSIIISILGGMFIGVVWPKIYDKLF